MPGSLLTCLRRFDCMPAHPRHRGLCPVAGAASPVTALAAFRLSRNTTVLLSGHASGELRLHALLLPTPASSAQQRAAAWQEESDEDAPPQPSLALLQVLAPDALLCATPSAVPSCGRAAQQQQQQQQQQGACAAAEAAGCAPITSLHAAARGSSGAATAVAVDARGRLAVLKYGRQGGERASD